jgi:opacity protein-like surface antigen
MKKLLVAAPLLALAAAAAAAADPGFDAIVRGVESGYGIQRMHVPFFGLARFVVKVARPEGVKDFDMAIFEPPDGAAVDSRRFDHIVRRATGDRWSSVIRVRSRRDGESTYVYITPAGREWRMLIATFKADEIVVLNARVDARILFGALDDPEHAGNSLGTQ